MLARGFFLVNSEFLYSHFWPVVLATVYAFCIVGLLDLFSE